MIQLVRNTDELAALSKEWNDLLSQSAADTVFLTWEWLSSWWDSYGTVGEDPYVILVRDAESKLVGVVALHQAKVRWPLISPKTLRLVGDGSSDSDYLDFILARGQETAVLDEVWDHLKTKRSGELILLSGIPQGSPTLDWLEKLRIQEGLVIRSETVECAVTHLPTTWDEYLMSLKPRFRTKVRSTLRTLAEEHDLRFYSVENEADLMASLDILFDLHSRRWKLKGQEGVFGNPAKRQFYERFTRQFLERGWLAFEFLELNGSTAACQLSFRYNGTQFLLQEGFDPQFSADSVGVALRALVFKKAIEDGIRNYDFLAGLGRHKTQWQVQLKSCRNVTFGPATLQNVVYLKTPLLVEAAKERLKAVIPDKVMELRRRLLYS